MIRNIIFDFGKVLVDYDYSLVMRNMTFDPAERAEFFRSIITHYWGDMLEREVTPFADVMQQMRDAYPYFSPHITALEEHFTECVTGEVSGMRSFLTELRQRGFRIYGLTNWCSKVYETMKQYDKIFSLLHGFVISSDVHMVKPEPGIYESLLQKYGLLADECVFVDDKSENIEGASLVGIRGILFANAPQCAGELQQMLGVEPFECQSSLSPIVNPRKI